MSVTAPDGTVWPAGSLRALEHQSIRDFVEQAARDGYLSGRVLDYGCGYAPYRSIVEAVGGEWYGYDEARFPDNHAGDVGSRDHFGYHRYADAILCSQVIQYLSISELVGTDEVTGIWDTFFLLLGGYRVKTKGHLVLTYPTNWPEAQPEDLYRFTASGIERLLSEAGFTIIRHESRASITCLGEKFSLGGGVIARAS